MMNSNDAAYPLEIATGQYSSGLTKRELFAAMAMQGILLSDRATSAEGRVYHAVKHADALIAELSKEVQGE
jgi:hypothetical protein